MAESLWAVGHRFADLISEAVHHCKVAQEGTPPAQIKEEEPITIAVW